MVQTIPLLDEMAVSARVTAVALNDDRLWAYGQVDGTVVSTTSKHKVAGSISSIVFQDEVLVIADDIDGISAYSGEEELWSIEVIDGVEKMLASKKIIALTGSGNLLLVDGNGKSSRIHESVRDFSCEHGIAIVDESQKVHLLDEAGNITWSRPVRGEHGERITALGWDGEVLVVAREGYALVPGDEEAFEVERWQNNQLIERFETPVAVSVAGKHIGLSDGGILGGIDLQYPVNNVAEVPEGLLVTSWFFVYLVKEDEIVWRVEHKGVAEMMAATSDGGLVIVAGEDQNDLTGNEPVLLLDSNANPIDAVEDTIEVTPIPEIEYAQLLTEEEQSQMGSTTQVEHDHLLSMLNEELLQESITEADSNLMEDLLHDVSEVIPPKVNAGDDIIASASQQGKATILLDGTSTSDPQDRIVSWSWIDSSGKEISSNPQVKVILARGQHRFDLRIRDDEGRWSSDSVFVNIGD